MKRMEEYCTDCISDELTEGNGMYDLGEPFIDENRDEASTY